MLKGNDNQFIGCARVRYATPEGAKRAIDSLGSQPLMGRPLIVRYDREPLTFTTGKLGRRWLLEEASRHTQGQPLPTSPPLAPLPGLFSPPRSNAALDVPPPPGLGGGPSTFNMMQPLEDVDDVDVDALLREAEVQMGVGW